MLVVFGVPLALVAAAPARLTASFDKPPTEVGVVLDLAGHDAHRRVAHIGAVEVQANALAKVLDIRFAEAGVGASRAALCAVDEGLDRVCEQLDVEIEGGRVCLDHRLGVVGVVRHSTLSLQCSAVAYPMLEGAIRSCA
jgi:hypothetical protein